MNQITLLVDKSALQGLSPREAKWLFHHFRLNFPPVFFAEVLADLMKRRPTTGTPEGDVKALAKKIVTYAVHPNQAAMDLLRAELAGVRIPMIGQIADQQGQIIEMPDGSKGLFIDSTPTQELLERWTKGQFDSSEKDFARIWREGMSEIRLEELFRTIKAVRHAHVKIPADVIRVVDRALTGRDFQLLKHAMALGNSPQEQVEAAISAWKRFRRPPIAKFLPYTFFTLRIELYFLIALANRVVSTRDSNRIDIEYLKYLPFTQVFCSSDKLHIETAPHFLLLHNRFVTGADLKASMGEIADRWDSVSEPTRALGTATYADFPPPELDNAVTQIYDFYIPAWRENANLPKPKISPEENARIMAELRPMMDAIERQRRGGFETKG